MRKEGKPKKKGKKTHYFFSSKNPEKKTQNTKQVGHTGDLAATTGACALVDKCLGELLEVCESLGGRWLVTADHGNADDMVQRHKKSKFFLTFDLDDARKKQNSLSFFFPLILFSFPLPKKQNKNKKQRASP